MQHHHLDPEPFPCLLDGFRQIGIVADNYSGLAVLVESVQEKKGGKPGRTLTPEDIEHYHRIVVALSETIRIMKQIDEVIEAHGGWSGAFAAGGDNG